MTVLIRQLKAREVDQWMDLVRLVEKEFPGLEDETDLFGYRRILIKNQERGTALTAWIEDQLVGVMLYGISAKKISFLATHPAYRKQGIGSKLVEAVLELFNPQDDIQVTTFRADDKRGDAPRRLYFKYGFEPSELVVAFDAPQQVLIRRGNNESC